MSEWSIWVAAFLATFFSLLLKTVPVTFLKGDNLPPALRLWLKFVPVSVMAALVGSDIFFYNGKLDISTNNLFLLVSIPTLGVAIWSRNYFVTIAAGIGMIIAARYFGMA